MTAGRQQFICFQNQIKGSALKHIGSTIGAVLVAAVALIVAPAAIAAPTGYLEICKKSTSVDAVSGPFQFSVDGAAAISVNTGGCSAPIQVAAGNHTVVESGTAASAVTAVDTIPADRLVSSSLSTRTDVVSVPEGDVSNTTTLEVTNQAQFGHLEICKSAQAGSGLTGTFNFRITGPFGFSKDVSVPVGACTNSLRVPAGVIEVDEVGPNDTDVVGVSTVTAGDLVADNLSAGTSEVRIAPGADVNNETIETFVNSTSRLKICKVAGTPSLVGTVFSFTANGQTVQAVAEPGSGGCALVQMPFTGGTRVDIQEGITPGTGVSAIDVSNNRQVPGSVDLNNRKVSVILGSGETVVTYTDVVVANQLLKVCKNAGPGVTVGTVFHFVINGTQNLDVPAGFCALAGTFAFNSTVSVQEAATAGLSVIGEASDPAVDLVSADLGGRLLKVLVGTGVTEATFTNATAGTAVLPPNTGGGTGNGAGGTSSPTTVPVTTPTLPGVTPTPVVEHPRRGAACTVIARIVFIHNASSTSKHPTAGLGTAGTPELLLTLKGNRAVCDVLVRELNGHGVVVGSLRRHLKRGHQVRVVLSRKVQHVRVTTK